MTWLVITGRPEVLTVGSGVALGALTLMAAQVVDAGPAVQASPSGAVVDLNIAPESTPSLLAHTLEVVDFLDTLQGALSGAWLGQTLVDIAFTPLANVPGWTPALIASNLINAGSSMMTGTLKAVINIDFALKALGPLGTGTLEVVDQVITGPSILTRLLGTVINIQFTLLTVVSQRTGAAVRSISSFVGANSTVHTRV